MSHWIFGATTHKVGGRSYSPEEILRQRFEDRFWGLGEKTPNRKSLKMGDPVVFYLGLPHKEFAGTAILESDSYKLSEKEREAVSHNQEFYRALYGVKLGNVQLWDSRKSVEELVPFLEFIVNKRSWFVYFQGGVRQVSDKDFRTLTHRVEEALPLPRSGDVESFESESQFALEAHLEDFMDKNWGMIDFGAKLKKYTVDEQDGRQFPAGFWSIDFLCTEEGTDDLVVIELKRGKSSDSTVGQILRYMGWVRENCARPGQNVKGIIIVKEVDDALRYAASGLGDVRILTYRVDFQLLPLSKSPGS